MKEIKFNWEEGINEISKEIKKYKKIGLQIPEGLRTVASEIIERIEEYGPNVFLWGEPTYGACDLADGPFADIKIEALIHMGHLPMPYHSDSYKIPVFFVPVRHSGDLELKKESIDKVKEILSDKIGIVSTAQHLHLIDSLKNELKKEGIDAQTSEGGPRIAAAAQLLGCNSSVARKMKVDGFLYLGTGMFHPLTVALSTGKPVVNIDPHTAEVTVTNPDLFLRQRYAAIHAAYEAKRWAIMFSTQIGQKRMDLTEKLVESLKKRNCQVLTIGGIHQSPEQIAGLNIEAATVTSCPRTAIEDGPTWPIPLLTVPELQIILGKREKEPYPFDEFA